MSAPGGPERELRPLRGRAAAKRQAWAEHTSLAARRSVFAAIGGGLGEALRGRSLLAIVAIAFGVALGYAVHLVNASAVRELASGIAVLSGSADLEVRGPRDGFAETIYPRVARDPDVADASPVVEVDAKLAARRDTLPIVGVDVFRAIRITPSLVAIGDDRLDTLRADAFYPSPAAARWLHVDPGDQVVVQVGLRDVALRVAGMLLATGEARYAVMDIAAAQRELSKEGRVDQIDVTLRPGADVAAVRARLAKSLVPGLVLGTAAARSERYADILHGLQATLASMSLMCMVAGLFVIHNGMAASVTHRMPGIATLRLIGADGAVLMRLLLVEAVVLGVLGSALGAGIGVALGRLLLSLVGNTVGTMVQMSFIVPEVAIDPRGPLLAAAIGVTVAVLGAWLPARRALRDPLEISDLAVDGDDLRRNGIPPGPWIGKILKYLLSRVIQDPSLNRTDWLLQEAKRYYAAQSDQGE